MGKGKKGGATGRSPVQGERVRVVEASAIQSWDDADDRLKDYGRLEMQKEEIEIEMNQEINVIKEEVKAKVKQLDARLELLRLQLEEFGESQKTSFDKVRTRDLNFGKCGYRKATNLTIKGLKEVLAKLKEKAMTDCITVKEAVNKDVLKQYDDDTLATIKGVKKIVTDNFWFEVDRERIKSCTN